VDPGWLEAFHLALVLRGVPAATLADTLVAVNDRVRASGVSTEQALGPAQEYADGLGLPSDPSLRGDHVFRRAFGVPAIIGAAGILLIIAATGPMRRHIDATITLGYLILAVAVLGFLTYVTLRSEMWVRATHTRGTARTTSATTPTTTTTTKPTPDLAPRATTLRELASVFAIAPTGRMTKSEPIIVALVTGVAAFFLWEIPVPLITLTPWPLMFLGVVLVGVSATITWFAVPADAPLTPPPHHPAPRTHKRVNAVLAALYPGLAVVLAGLAWLLS